MIIKSGIYKIINVVTNKVYIGSAINLYKRKNQHFRQLRRGKHPNKLIQNSFNKYGEINFVFDIVEWVEDTNMLIVKEQYYLDLFKPEMNILKKAGSMLGYKHSIESKNKMKESQLKNYELHGVRTGFTLSVETKNKLRNLWLGKKRPKEVIDKITKNNAKYWSNKKRSIDTINKRKKKIITKKWIITELC